MDIHSQIIRDRRIAASDETVSVAGSAIYGRGSHARELGAGGRSGDRQSHEISTIILHQTAGAMISGGAIAPRPTTRSAATAPDRLDERLDQLTAGQDRRYRQALATRRLGQLLRARCLGQRRAVGPGQPEPGE